MPLYWPSTVAWSLLALPLSLWADRQYHRLPPLAAGAPPSHLPPLSIIIPARNEARNLRRLLPSLQAMRYPGPCEMIVVDDGSEDGTGDVAAQAGARVIRLAGPPPGVLGKPHACHEGALAATGEWLLFTDADTVHAADGLATAVAHAQRAGLDGLSLFLRQECRGWLDGLALMTGYAGLFAGFRPDAGWLNGQYILLRRDVYVASGGFAAVWGEPLEDLALGGRLRGLGYRVPLLRGEDAASVRMYESAGQMWHGLTRLGAGSLRWQGAGALGSAMLITALMSPLLTTYGVARGFLGRRWLGPVWVAAGLGMLPWARRFGPGRRAALAPLGALVVQGAAVWGLVNRLLGRGVKWRGRRV